MPAPVAHNAAPDPTTLDCAVRANWPNELIIRCRLDELHRTVKAERVRRTVLIRVGRVLASSDHGDSRLYDAEHFHLLRPKKKRKQAE